MRLLVRWLISAVSIMIVAYLVPGFVVHGVIAALIAAVIIGLVNATLGSVVKILTFAAHVPNPRAFSDRGQRHHAQGGSRVNTRL